MEKLNYSGFVGEMVEGLRILKDDISIKRQNF